MSNEGNHMTTVLLDAGGIILDESAQEERHAQIIVTLLSGHFPDYTAADYYTDICEAVTTFCPNAYEFVLWKRTAPNTRLFDALSRQHREEYRRTRPPLVLFPGIVSEIRHLAERFRVVSAGQYGHELLAVLEAGGIADCFDTRLTQDDFNLTKPDPRYYAEIISSLDESADSCIMVGDRVDKDVIPAKMLGMKTVRIRIGLHRNQQARIPWEEADLTLEKVDGLAAAIRGLASEEIVPMAGGPGELFDGKTTQ